MPIIMKKKDLEAFIAKEFPQVSSDFVIDSVREQELVTRLRVAHHHLRPGGTVSGPAMFALADVSVYLAILSQIGPWALAVTTNCSIDFMRKPVPDADLIARTRLLKLGRMLAVGDVHLASEGSDKLVARATLTYSIPPS